MVVYSPVTQKIWVQFPGEENFFYFLTENEMKKGSTGGGSFTLIAEEDVDVAVLRSEIFELDTSIKATDQTLTKVFRDYTAFKKDIISRHNKAIDLLSSRLDDLRKELPDIKAVRGRLSEVVRNQAIMAKRIEKIEQEVIFLKDETEGGLETFLVIEQELNELKDALVYTPLGNEYKEAEKDFYEKAHSIE